MDPNTNERNDRGELERQDELPQPAPEAIAGDDLIAPFIAGTGAPIEAEEE